MGLLIRELVCLLDMGGSRRGTVDRGWLALLGIRWMSRREAGTHIIGLVLLGPCRIGMFGPRENGPCQVLNWPALGQIMGSSPIKTIMIKKK